MKKIIFLIFSIFILVIGCKGKEQNEVITKSELNPKKEILNDSLGLKALQLVEYLKKGDTENIRKQFISLEYFDELGTVENSIKSIQSLIANLQIDKPKNFIYQNQVGSINTKAYKNDTIEIITIYVPLGIEMPSPVPQYFAILHYMKVKNENKLGGFDLKSTKGTPLENSNLKVQDKILINKEDIKEVSLMYEGGHKAPKIFKRKQGSINELGEQQEGFEELLKTLNTSKIIKSRKEFDTRRFKGDPELCIINIDLENNFNWTIFHIISEESKKEEEFYGTLELRYYEYLNVAVTYWVTIENSYEIQLLMEKLGKNASDNLRNAEKESDKLILEKNDKK